MEHAEVLAVLDYGTGLTHIYKVTPEIAENPEGFIEKEGFKGEDIHWMIGSDIIRHDQQS